MVAQVADRRSALSLNQVSSGDVVDEASDRNHEQGAKPQSSKPEGRHEWAKHENSHDYRHDDIGPNSEVGKVIKDTTKKWLVWITH